MKLQAFLLSVVLSLGVVPAHAEEPTGGTPTEVTASGERGTLRGTVAEVVRRDNGYVFINVGGVFPDHQFAVRVHKMDVDEFPDMDSWVGSEIEFSGVVETYNQKPMLRIRKPEDVVIVAKSNAAAR